MRLALCDLCKHDVRSVKLTGHFLANLDLHLLVAVLTNLVAVGGFLHDLGKSKILQLAAGLGEAAQGVGHLGLRVLVAKGDSSDACDSESFAEHRLLCLLYV